MKELQSTKIIQCYIRLFIQYQNHLVLFDMLRHCVQYVEWAGYMFEKYKREFFLQL